MRKYLNIIGGIGLLLFLYGLITAIFYSKVPWLSYFVIGGVFFLGYINYRYSNESVIRRLETNKTEVFKTYLVYLFAGLIIEFIGRFLLHLWEYPLFNITDEIIHVFLIVYPFGFFFIYETFVFIRKKVQNFGLAIIVTTLVNAFLVEVPNTFVWEWRYTIPYITFEILRVNIIVIIGWVFLVMIPLMVKELLGKKSKL